LAKHGFSGPPTALEGKFGFLHAYSGNPKLKGMVEDLGKEYKILQTAIKFYPCVYYVQAAVDAMLEIVNNYELIPEQVELIKVDTLTAGFNIACHPIDKKRHPATILDAQFSMYFNVAVALLKKRVTLAEYTPEMFHSPILQEIMNKIHCETDSTFDAMYPEAWPARVTILTKKGKTLVAEIKFPKGDPHNPLSWDELVIKHKSIVKGILSDAEDEKLIAFVRDLEKQIHFDVLSEILRNF
jgi:2-methylcitrate dehydratase PrpD